MSSRLPRPAHALIGLALGWAAGCASADSVSPELNEASAVDRAVVRVRACDGPAASLSAALAAAAGLPTPPNPSAPGGAFTINDYLSALARRTPGGFAGVMYDNNGTRPVLLLVDPARAAEAKAALAGQLPNFDVAAAEVRAARWDFAQLYDWQRYLYTQGIWASDLGLTVASIDVRENRVYLGGADAAARDRIVARLTALDLPCDLVRVGVSGRPMLL